MLNPNDKNILVAIPLMNEFENISTLMECLADQKLRAKVIALCVNQPKHWSDSPDKKEIVCNNIKTLNYLNQISTSYPIKLIILDHASTGKGFASKIPSVGLARKLCIDALLPLANDDDIIVNIDADTYYPSNYLNSLYNIYKQLPLLQGICAPYYHKINNLSSNQALLMLRYEIFLRYYTIQLLLIKSPYAYMPIGSAISFTVRAYKKSGRFKIRDAGEDFYTMQKIRKIGMVSGWSDTNVYPSARSSDRVVFGTGPAINLTLREQSKKYPFYPTQLFEAIRDIYQSIEHFDMIDDIVNHLEKIIPREIITKIHNNNPKKHRFIHAIHEYFDAFHIIKYLNKNYKVDPEKDFEHFKKFIKINFNKEIKYDKWEQIPIDELNTIR
ncbi:MAG: hypothetical protein WAP21_05855, partial [Bacteroidales bacterium]